MIFLRTHTLSICLTPSLSSACVCVCRGGSGDIWRLRQRWCRDSTGRSGGVSAAWAGSTEREAGSTPPPRGDRGWRRRRGWRDWLRLVAPPTHLLLINQGPMLKCTVLKPFQLRPLDTPPSSRPALILDLNLSSSFSLSLAASSCSVLCFPSFKHSSCILDASLRL